MCIELALIMFLCENDPQARFIRLKSLIFFNGLHLVPIRPARILGEPFISFQFCMTERPEPHLLGESCR